MIICLVKFIALMSIFLSGANKTYKCAEGGCQMRIKGIK